MGKQWMHLRVKSRSTKWRDAVKENNPDKYELLKKVDAARQKVKYNVMQKRTADRQLNRDERAAQKEKREKSAAKQRLYRERKKAAKCVDGNSEQLEDADETMGVDEQVQQIETPEAVNEFETAADTLQTPLSSRATQWRAKQSRQKKSSLKGKDTLRKSTQRNAVAVQPGTPTAVRRSKRLLLPNSPSSYASKVRELVDHCTPKKKTALSAINIQPGHKDREACIR